MAEQLDPTGTYASEPRTYPWDDWLNGAPWRLTLDYPDKPGDFVPEPATFRPYIYTVARNRGLKVCVAVEGDDIVLQAYRPGERRPSLPTLKARLQNGRPDPHTPLHRPSTAPYDPERACRHCGARLTPASIVHGECRKIQDPAYRCTQSGAGAYSETR